MKKAKTGVQSPSLKPDSFESVAKRLECDDDAGRFESALGKIARASPQPAATKSEPKRKPH